MGMLRWKKGSNSEQLLRAARPEAPESLVQRLALQATPTRRAGAPRFALAGVATAAMLVGLAAVGGVSYAANEVAHIASVATGHTNHFGKRLAIAINTSSAANDQYGGQQTSSQTQSKPAAPNTSGAISVQPSGASGPGGPTIVSVDWGTTTFAAPVFVHVDPAPPAVTSSALVGVGNQIVSIIVTDSSGQAIHQLAAPLAIRFSNPPKNFVPVVSTDGVNFRALTLITGTELTADQQDGYYVDTNGDIVVLTRHLTLFAVLYKANITTSESGRQAPQAGSGAFGDPTRNHTGAPVLQQVGSTITPHSNGTAVHVPFTFHVDEQAAIFISIYDAKGNPLWINKTGTFVRLHPYAGKAVHTLHLVILRPGQIKTLLKVAEGALVPGQKYKIRITAQDFDGHKVTEFTTFTA
jgi:hypothetical protein